MQALIKIPARVEFRIVNGKLIKVSSASVSVEPGTIAEAIKEIKEEV